MNMQEITLKSDISETIKKGQSFLGVLYLLMIAVGMLFSYKKYAEFGINIFEYADVFDFFIAPFTDIYIMVFAVITMFVIILLIWFDTWLERKSLRVYTWLHMGINKKKWFKQYLKMTFAAIFIIYMFLASMLYAKFSTKEINLAYPIRLNYVGEQAKIGKQIGKTKEVIFLLAGNDVYVVPITSLVKEIKITTLQDDKD